MKVIFGSSGFAKEVYLILVRLFSSKVKIECFVCSDDDPSQGQKIKGLSIIRECEFFKTYNNKHINAYIAVGSPATKKKIVDKIKKLNFNVDFPNLIDPYASVDTKNEFINIGQGVIICAGAALTIDIEIGDFSHINLNSTIGHDVVIGKFSTLSPATNISGKVKIGEMVFLGTGSAILEDIVVTDCVVVGAGAVVVHDIVESGTYVGVPAKKIK